MKTYPLKKTQAPLLLACGKCQKRLKRDGNQQGIVPLRKVLKSISRESGVSAPSVLKVPCLKLCPGNGLVVLTARHVASGGCSILRSRADVAAIARELHEIAPALR